jgi:hypothetical protein
MGGILSCFNNEPEPQVVTSPMKKENEIMNNNDKAVLKLKATTRKI